MRLFRRKTQHIGLQELSDLIDDRLAGTRKEQVEAHLASCDLCREELEGLRYGVDLLQQVPMLAPRRRLVMQEAPAPAVARPMVMSWAYGAAASVAVLLAVVLGADLLGALPGGGIDFATEESAFSDDQPDVPFPMEAEVAESDEAELASEPFMESEAAAKSLADEAVEAMEDESSVAPRAERSAIEDSSEPDEGEGTHVLWRVLEGVLAAFLALLLVVVVWRILRSRRPIP